MHRKIASRLKWLAGTLLALGLSACITYTGEYANDGYYSAPIRGNAYNDGYYGDYYYSAVPTINISYNLFFGYPFYSYAGCRYWSPYCGLFYPGYGYGYGYGPGYGFGWGNGPHYGHQNPPHHHKPKPPHNRPDPVGGGRPIVKQPNRPLPVNPVRGRPQQQFQSPTPPVSTGSSTQVVTAPPATANAPSKTVYWRIPADQRQAAPIVRRDAPVQREDNQPDAEYVQVERTPRAGNYPVRYRQADPAAIAETLPVAQEAQQDAKPERQARQAVREPKQARDVPQRKVNVDTVEDP